MEKFPQARDLLSAGNASVEIELVAPAPARQLLRVHTSEYLRKLAEGYLDPTEAY